MSETILVPFVYPVSKIITAFPYKFVLDDDWVEFYAKHSVEEWDEHSAMMRIADFDTRLKLMRDLVSSIEMYKSAEYADYYIIKLGNVSADISMYFKSKAEAMELYNKLDKWLFNANS